MPGWRNGKRKNQCGCLSRAYGLKNLRPGYNRQSERSDTGYPIGNVTFPAGIYFEWINGAWTARDSTQLKHFMPGPGSSITEPKCSGKDAGLPPGMTRGK